MLGAIPHTKIQDKENQNDLFLLERDNQFVWESLGQIKLFEGEKEASETNGQSLQTLTNKLKWLHILKIKPLDCMFFMFLTCMSNFIQMGYYLLLGQSLATKLVVALGYKLIQ